MDTILHHRSSRLKMGSPDAYGLPATGHVVAAVGPSRCRVTFTVPVWAPFYVPVCRAALRRLRDLALAAEAD